MASKMSGFLWHSSGATWTQGKDSVEIPSTSTVAIDTADVDPSSAESVASLKSKIRYAHALVMLKRQDIPVEVILAFEQEIDENWDEISELEDKKKLQRGGCKDPKKEATLEVMGRHSRITGHAISDLIEVHFSLYQIFQSPDLARSVENEVRRILDSLLTDVFPLSTGLPRWKEELIIDLLSDIETMHLSDLPEEDLLRYDGMSPGERVSFWLGRLEQKDPLRSRLYEVYHD